MGQCCSECCPGGAGRRRTWRGSDASGLTPQQLRQAKAERQSLLRAAAPVRGDAAHDAADLSADLPDPPTAERLLRRPPGPPPGGARGGGGGGRAHAALGSAASGYGPRDGRGSACSLHSGGGGDAAAARRTPPISIRAEAPGAAPHSHSHHNGCTGTPLMTPETSPLPVRAGLAAPPGYSHFPLTSPQHCPTEGHRDRDTAGPLSPLHSSTTSATPSPSRSCSPLPAGRGSAPPHMCLSPPDQPGGLRLCPAAVGYVAPAALRRSAPSPQPSKGPQLPPPGYGRPETIPAGGAGRAAADWRRGSVVDSIYSDDTDESASVALPSPPANSSESAADGRAADAGSGWNRRASVDEYESERLTRRLHSIKKEIYDTEVTYCAGLAELSDFYLEQMKQMLDTERKRAGARSPHVDIFDEVFGSLMNIRACNDLLLKDMRSAICDYQQQAADRARQRASAARPRAAEAAALPEGDGSPPRGSVSPPPSAVDAKGDFSGVNYGQVFMKNFKLLRLYASYINSYDAFIAYLKTHGVEQDAGNRASTPLSDSGAPPSRLASFLSKTQRLLEQARGGDLRRDLSLFSYLITPIQRLMNYRMMLQQLAGSSRADDPSTAGLRRACQEITSVCNYCNQKKRESDGTVKVVEISEELALPDLVKPGRFWLMDGEMEKVTKGSSGRQKTTACRVFLFSDVILCVKRRWGLAARRAYWIRLEDIIEVLDEFPQPRASPLPLTQRTLSTCGSDPLSAALPSAEAALCRSPAAGMIAPPAAAPKQPTFDPKCCFAIITNSYTMGLVLGSPGQRTMWAEGVSAAQRQWHRRSIQRRKGSIIGINLNEQC